MNVNNIRNAVIDATVTVITKAKAKPPTIGQRIDAMINDPMLTDEVRTDLVESFELALNTYAEERANA